MHSGHLTELCRSKKGKLEHRKVENDNAKLCLLRPDISAELQTEKVHPLCHQNDSKPLRESDTRGSLFFIIMFRLQRMHQRLFAIYCLEFDLFKPVRSTKRSMYMWYRLTVTLNNESPNWAAVALFFPLVLQVRSDATRAAATLRHLRANMRLQFTFSTIANMLIFRSNIHFYAADQKHKHI